jgi:hypothetical protein
MYKLGKDGVDKRRWNRGAKGRVLYYSQQNNFCAFDNLLLIFDDNGLIYKVIFLKGILH